MRLQEHHRHAARLEFAMEPGRPSGRLVADQIQLRRIELEHTEDRFGVGRDAGLKHDRAVEAVDDADRRDGGGSVECGIKFHRKSSSAAGWFGTTILRLICHQGRRPALTHLRVDPALDLFGALPHALGS